MMACESRPFLRGPATFFNTTGVEVGEWSMGSSLFTRRAALYSAVVLPVARSFGTMGASILRVDDRNLKMTKMTVPVMQPMRLAVPK
jgi:hypothetical protein